MNLPKPFIQSAKACHLDIELMQKKGLAHLYIESNKILSSQKVSGLKISTERFAKGVKIKMIVQKGRKIERPIFLCFGILGLKGEQYIKPEIILEENAQAEILAHCTFPQAKGVLHQMDAKIKLKRGAQLLYLEKHYHGEKFGTSVRANFDVVLGEETSFKNEFSLETGSVGKLKINLKAVLYEKSFAEILSKVVEKGARDKVEILDKVALQGKESRSLVKMRGAAVNGGSVFFQGEMKAEKAAQGARGHVDCPEIIVGKNSFAQSIPIVSVLNPEARVTHEASVGKVNQKELETLLTRGLSEKEAIDFIVRGKTRK